MVSLGRRDMDMNVTEYNNVQYCSPNSNCSNGNIAVLTSYFQSPSEHLM